MALVAMMRASSVQQHGGTPWTPCDEDDDGAVALDVAFKDYAAPPKWLRGAAFVRLAEGVSHEQFELNCVYSGDPDDPNSEFSLASPSGKLTLTVHNPKAMGYVKPGRAYRVTIEEIRGPRQDNQTKNMTVEAEGSVKLTVNTREFSLGPRTVTVNPEAITYEELCRFARKDPASQPTVTWHAGGRGGSLLPGDTVSLLDGMHVTVANTTSA